jgi:hypothetical protein
MNREDLLKAMHIRPLGVSEKAHKKGLRKMIDEYHKKNAYGPFYKFVKEEQGSNDQKT